jgi:hypothetical protein
MLFLLVKSANQRDRITSVIVEYVMPSKLLEEIC